MQGTGWPLTALRVTCILTAVLRPFLVASLLFLALVPEAEAQRASRATRLRPPAIEETPEIPSPTRPPIFALDSIALFEQSTGPGGQPATGRFINTATLAARTVLPDGFSLYILARFEPIPVLEGERGALPSHAAWLDNFHLRWERGPLFLFAGKIHPRFSQAWSRAPGYYGADFAGEYELRDKIGFGGRLILDRIFGFDESLGRLNLQAEAFQTDRLLSASVFHPRWLQTVTTTDPATGEASTRILRRWQNSLALGGADNAEGLPGFVASLAASRIALGEARFGYMIGLSFRRPGQDTTQAGLGRTERGIAAGAYGRIPLPFGIAIAPLIEVVRQDQASGYAGRRAEWLTAGITVERGALSASHVVMLRREQDEAAASRAFARQHAANVTLALGRATGLAALEPFAATLDWRHLAQGGTRERALAAGVVYSRRF